MRKILIGINSYFPFEDANTNCLMPLINKLKKDNEIYIITYNHYGKEKSYEEIDGVKVFRASASKYQKFRVRISEKRHSKDCNMIKKVLDLGTYYSIGTILKLTEVISSKIFEFPFYSKDTVVSKKIEEIINLQKIDLLITVISPGYMHYSGLRLKKNGVLDGKSVKWVAYFMDPDATYIGFDIDTLKERMEKEEQIYKYADKVIITPEMYRENEENLFKKYLDKTGKLPLANLRNICVDSKLKALESENINCIYIGSLQDLSVRNPEYYLKIIKCIKDEKFKFHFIGNIVGESKVLVDRYVGGSKNIILHGRKSLDECYDIMTKADILINLGNICTNQTPSKIFDYIGCGAPIINFYSKVKDTSKYYLKNYRLKLNIEDKDKVDDRDVSNFIKFCYESKNIRVDYSEIQNSYKELTEESVSEQFLKILEDVNE